MDTIAEDPVQETAAAQEDAQTAAEAAREALDERLIDRYELLVEEVRKQLQALQGVGEWVEEFGQLEDSYGKALGKVASWGVHPTGWMAEVDVAWDTARNAVEKIGKQHLGLAICISQSIGKRLVEFSHQKRAELKQCVGAYRQALSEVNRARSALQKSKQRYARSVEDADQALQARDRLASDTGGRDSANAKERSEPDRFLNKVQVLGKLTPESLPKLQDRAADAVADVENTELDYKQRIVAVNHAVEVFKRHMRDNLATVKDIEAARLSFLRDSLMRLHQAIRGATDIMASLRAGVGASLTEFDAQIDLVSEAQSMSMAAAETKGPHDAKQRAAHETYTTTLLLRAHDALNGVDSLRRFLLDICNCIAEGSAAEATFAKGALRTLEKHGLTSFSKNGTQSRSTIRNGWMHSTGILQELSQAHSEAAAFMADTLYVQVAEFQDEQERLRKIHTDQYNNKVRLLESHRAALQKAYVRQSKLSKELRERTTSMQRASDGNGTETRSRLSTEDSGSLEHSIEDSSEQSRTQDGSQSLDEVFLEQLQSQGQKVLHTFGLLETSDQRTNRLESQLEQLRAASSACDQQVLVAEVRLQQETREVCQEASAVLSTVTQTVNAGFTRLKQTLGDLVVLQRESMERVMQRLDVIWVELQRIDQAADMQLMLQRCIHKPDGEVLGDIKDPVAFTSMKTDRISLESARSPKGEQSATRRPRSRLSLNRRSRSNEPPQKNEPTPKLGVNFQEAPMFSTQMVKEQGETPSSSTTRTTTRVEEPSLIDLAVSLPTMQRITFDDSRGRRLEEAVENSPAHSDLMGELIDDNSISFGSPHAGELPMDEGSLSDPLRVTATSDESPHNGSLDHNDDLDSTVKPTEGTPRDSALLKFHIPDSEKVLRSYVCAYYPRRGLPVHGKMAITQQYICFTGWPNVRMQMSLVDIHRIEKSNSMFFVPNAIEITTDPTKDSLFFASFLERDDCYDFLHSMIDIAQGLRRITDPTAAVDIEPQADTSSENEARWLNELESALPLHAHDMKGWKELEATIFDDPEISRLLEATVAGTARSLVVKSWLDDNFYKNFLTSLGDTVLSVAPWSAAKQDPDDDFLSRSVGGLRFSQRRDLQYEHPRTQMLFIGPKNATAQQRHYLVRLQASADGSDGDSEGFIACTLTDFSGIPFGDHFAVMACWLIYDTNMGGSPSTRVIAGVRVFMRKQTVMKSRIRTGTDEEMKVMLEQWLAAAKSAGSPQQQLSSGAEQGTEQQSAGPLAQPVTEAAASGFELPGTKQSNILLLCFICLLLLVVWRLSSFQYQLQSMQSITEQQSKTIQDLIQLLESIKAQQRTH